MRILVTAFLVVLLGMSNAAQDKEPEKKPEKPEKHPAKIRGGRTAYEKAVKYVTANLSKARFQAKMVCGWLLLADGRYPDELESVIKEAMQWKRWRKNIQHAQNWYPALAGILLSEYYKYNPKEEVLKGMEEIVKEFEEKQERTGGWFKWHEGAVKDMPGYPVRDLGILDAMVYGFLLSARNHGVKVNHGTLQRGNECLMKILGSHGISYGTGQRGGDTTGARGGYAMLGLDDAKMRSHRIWSTYSPLIPKCIPRMDKGHHIGALHCLGLTLACRKLGSGVHGKLLSHWLPKLSRKQGDDGSLYVGDDGADGGEKGLFGGNHGSTAAFALMILLQDRDILNPKKSGKNSSGRRGGSPFGRKKPKKDKKKEK